MRQSELSFMRCFVGIDGLGTDEELLADLRCAEAARNVAQDVALAFSQLLVLLSLVRMLGLAL
jgi:hypothetical protein